MTNAFEKCKSLRKWSVYVKRTYGKAYLTQIREILRLRKSASRLGATDYYKYHLYDDLRFDWEAKQTFAGWRIVDELDRRLNSVRWLGVTTDKLIVYSVLRGLEIPTPRLLCVYHPSGRFFGAVPSFNDVGELGRFLRQGMRYPFFAKPVHGSVGVGAYAVSGVDSAKDELQLLDGRRVAVEEFVLQCRSEPGIYPWESGYLFQEYVRPHARIVEVCGPRLSSVRIIVLLSDAGPRVHMAVWKVTTGSNVTDNWRHGQAGNLLAWVDIHTGEVVRVVGRSASAPDLEDYYGEVELHPDTGQRLKGFAIPQWPEFVELVKRASTIYPALRVQHWDIAITDNGPVALEINIGGDLDLPQLTGQGFLSPRFVEFLEELRASYRAYR